MTNRKRTVLTAALLCAALLFSAYSTLRRLFPERMNGSLTVGQIRGNTADYVKKTFPEDLKITRIDCEDDAYDRCLSRVEYERGGERGYFYIYFRYVGGVGSLFASRMQTARDGNIAEFKKALHWGERAMPESDFDSYFTYLEEKERTAPKPA